MVGPCDLPIQPKSRSDKVNGLQFRYEQNSRGARFWAVRNFGREMICEINCDLCRFSLNVAEANVVMQKQISRRPRMVRNLAYAKSRVCEI